MTATLAGAGDMSELNADLGNARESHRAVGKRDKGVMVYLTEAEREAFKRWAFENDVSMSHFLAVEAVRLTERGSQGADLSSSEADDVVGLTPCVGSDDTDVAVNEENLDALVTLASQRHRIDTELEDQLWLALVDGARVPDLVAITGLTQEQIREILRRPPW